MAWDWVDTAWDYGKEIVSGVGEWLSSSSDSVVSETVKGAAIGAVVGGAASAVSGGDWEDGAKKGAIGGATIYGGASLLNSPGNQLETTTDRWAEPNKFKAGNPVEPTQGLIQPNQGSDQTGNGGAWNSVKGFWDDMTPAQGELVAGVASGLGKGLLASYASEEEREEAERDYERNRRKIQPGVRSQINMPTVRRI